MADPTYGKRTGVTTLRATVYFLARLILRWRVKIDIWVNSAVDPAYRAEVTAILDSIVSLSNILQGTPDD